MGIFSQLAQMLFAPLQIILTFIISTAISPNRHVANRRPQQESRRGSGSRTELWHKIFGQFISPTKDQLTAAFLRNAKFPGIFNLAVDTIARLIYAGLVDDVEEVGASPMTSMRIDSRTGMKRK